LFIFIEALYKILHKLRFVKFYICKLRSFQIDACHAHDKKMESLTEWSCGILEQFCVRLAFLKNAKRLEEIYVLR